MRLQCVCAAGIWVPSGKGFEKETIISCIYHKFQVVYLGIAVWKQTAHWWNWSNFTGKFHLKCLIRCSAANSLMFTTSLKFYYNLFFFLKSGFLGHELLGDEHQSMNRLFSPIQQQVGCLLSLEWGFVLVFKHVSHREKHHMEKCQRTCNVWNRYGSVRHTVACMCRPEKNISLTKIAFLDTNHIFTCFCFESFNEKIGKLQGRHSICSQLFSRRAVVFSADSSLTITWFV